MSGKTILFHAIIIAFVAFVFSAVFSCVALRLGIGQ